MLMAREDVETSNMQIYDFTYGCTSGRSRGRERGRGEGRGGERAGQGQDRTDYIVSRTCIQ